MKSLQNIFSASLEENKNNKNLSAIIHELTFELSKKRIQRLKDDANIQNRLGELFEVYMRSLNSANLETKENIEAIISGLIKAANHDKEEFLYKTIYEKEQLEKYIEEQKSSIRHNILNTFNILESHIQNMENTNSDISLQALSDTKLKSIEMLGILRETASEALLTTLEKAVDIEDTAFEITKNITYQAINEGDFLKKRFLDISKNIIEVAIEIADNDQANAKELLSGVIHGTKEGMAKAIDKFKNDLKFAPEEIEDLSNKNLSNIKKELIRVEDDFISLLEELKNISDGISKEIISNILDEELNSSLAKIKRVTAETSETISQKIEELKNNSAYLDNDFIKKAEKKIEELEKIAEEKVESIKNSEATKKAAKEAKRVGEHAWKLAKNALKSAQDAIKK
ncbi:DUF6781 family protein [Sulfurospirillum sp. 1307]